MTDREIESDVQNGKIVISNYTTDQLHTYSYYVKLGATHYRPLRVPAPIVYDCDGGRCSWSDPEEGDLELTPREMALCHSEEFVGSLSGSIPELLPLFLLTNQGINLVVNSYVGVGSVNRLVFCLVNTGCNNIVIPAGTEVARVVFHRIGTTDKDVTVNPEDSYVTNLLTSLNDTWYPELLLPANIREPKA